MGKRGPKPNPDRPKKKAVGGMYMMGATERCIRRKAREKGMAGGKYLDTIFAPHIIPADESTPKSKRKSP